VLPDTAKEKPQRGKVVAVGPGKLLDSGKRGRAVGAVGDEVIYGKYGGTTSKSTARSQDPARERHPGEGRQVRSGEACRDRASTTRATSTPLTNQGPNSTQSNSPEGTSSWQSNCCSKTTPARSCCRASTKLADAVAVTMGPTGRNVIIDKSFGGPTVTKDGVTVSKEIELEDRFENMGAKLVNEVAQKTSDLAGDGTTTATVLARAIFKEGLRNIVAGSNPMAVRAASTRPSKPPTKQLDEMAKPVTSKERSPGRRDQRQQRPAIGDLLADALEKVGKDGVITVEEGKTTETTLEFVDGMQFDKGYISPYFINRPADDGVRPGGRLILIHEKKISNSATCCRSWRRSPDGQAAADHRRGRRERGADAAGRQQAPRRAQRLRGQGPRLRRSPQGDAGRHRRADRRHADQRGPGHQARERHAEHLGRAKKITSTRTTRRSSKAAGKRADIEKRVEQIRKQIEQTDSEYDKEKFQERLAKLAGGVAIIRSAPKPKPT
jgi:chaperonin GroEL